MMENALGNKCGIGVNVDELGRVQRKLTIDVARGKRLIELHRVKRMRIAKGFYRSSVLVPLND
jgi:hypothetical protein